MKKRPKSDFYLILASTVLLAAILAAPIIFGIRNTSARWREKLTVLDLRALTLAAQIYAEDNGGILPEATNWCEQITHPIGTNSRPSLDPWDLDRYLSRKPSGYALNELVAGRKLQLLSTNEILFLPVTTRGRNLSVTTNAIENLAWDREDKITLVDVTGTTHELFRPPQGTD